MIERKIVAERIREFQIEEYISKNLRNGGHSHTKVQRTPLGEKIIIFASRPGLIVGRKGQNIKKLTLELKNKFNLENPQLEISDVENINLDAKIVAERIAASLERYGSQRFKGVAHRVMQDVMGSGALGVELVISGKIPSTRAKSWRFYQGYLKKCGDIALAGVDKAHTTAKLKSGIVGIKVSIMPSTTKLPDDMEVSEEPLVQIEEIKEEEPRKKARKRAKKAKKKEIKPEKKKEKKITKAKESKVKTEGVKKEMKERPRKKEKAAVTGAEEKPEEKTK